jgi:hypothetical protein
MFDDDPTNLVIEAEPDYKVRIDYPGGPSVTLFVRDRCTWKRLSAICHARYFAQHNPNCVVNVVLYIRDGK